MSHDHDHVTCEVSLETANTHVLMKVPQSHVETILTVHNFMAQHGMPAISVRTLRATASDDD